MRLLLQPPSTTPFPGPFYLIDTCSLIALQDVEIAGKSVLEFARENLRLTATEILADEIDRRLVDGLLRRGEGGIWLRKYRHVSKRQQIREDWGGLKSLCSGTPPLKDSKGEVSAAWLAITHSTRAFESVVFVTDDKKSRNLFFDNLSDHFPLVRIFDTLDFVRSLVLCASVEKRILLPQAISALKDSIATKAKNTTPSGMNEVTRAELTSRLIQESTIYQAKMKTAYEVINSQTT